MLRSLLLALILIITPAAAADIPARDLFSAATTPTAGPSIPVGSYARGCLAGAVQLPTDGPTWQVMRLKRDRRWGTPELVGYIEKLAEVATQDGWPGLLVGDLGQVRGGPTKSGHASHQTGLDVDLWFEPMPEHTLSPEERETKSASSVLKEGTRTVDPEKFGEAQRMLVYRAAQFPEVARIFVAPGIKRSLCAVTWRDRSFLSKIRPWYGHDDHFHVRLSCPPGSAYCVDQTTAPPGDGCGADLDYWFTEEPYKPTTPAPPLTLADLPKECRTVLEAR